MKIKRMAKRLFAVGTGVLMLGATAMGAMAADLKNYPTFFVKDGVFDGYMVVGENAASVDNLAMTDIAASMKYMKSTDTTTVSVEGENYRIGSGSDNLNLGDALNTVQSTAIDYEDLPTTLAKGTYVGDDGVEFAYEQELNFATGTFELFSDNDYKSKEPTLGVKVPRNNAFMNYSIKFTKSPESSVSSGSLTNFVDTTMRILGVDYDIITATNASALKFVMLSGALKDTLHLEESKTYTVNGKEYEVTVDFIDSSSSKARFTINGESTDSLAEGAIKKLKDGTNIAVKDVMTSSKESVTDRVEFYLGAKKLTLEDAQLVELNDVDVDQLTVNFLGESFGTKTSFSSIVFTWKPDEDSFVAEGSDLDFPAFDTYTLSYKGLNTPSTESVKVENAGDKEMDLVMPIKSGTATVRLLGSNTTNFVRIGGDDASETLLTAYSTSTAASGVLSYNSSLHEMFPVTYLSGTAGESYLLEVSKVHATDGVTFKDVVSGTTWENKKNGTSFSVGGATITLNNYTINTADEVVVISNGANTYFDRLVSEDGLVAWLPQSNDATKMGYWNNTLTSWTLYLKEEDKNGNLGTTTAGGQMLNVTLGHTSSKVEVTAQPATYYASEGSDTTYEVGDTDAYVGYVQSDLATKVMYDTNPNQNTLTLEYYGDEVYGQLYLLGKGASSSVSMGGVPTAVTVVDATKLDSEIADVNAQNLLVVGGPCVNGVAVTLLGSSADNCAEGFTPGKARIKLFENGGKVAMLVAGYSGEDTRTAGRVLANTPEKVTAVGGTEVEVETVTSTVSVPKPVEVAPVEETTETTQ